MKRYLHTSLALVLLLVVLAACGKPASVGTEDVLEFDEQTGQRLGQRASPEPEPTDAAGAIGRASPTPSPSPSPEPEKFFDIYLVSNSPFFEAEGPGLPRHEATQWELDQGFTLRVTNEDDCDCRSTRSFEAADGTFTSGPMKLGDSWSIKLTQAGEWVVNDGCCPFLQGTQKLTVRPRSG